MLIKSIFRKEIIGSGIAHYYGSGQVQRTREVRSSESEDAVNDFGVPEKSKYSTATKPVLLK